MESKELELPVNPGNLRLSCETTCVAACCGLGAFEFTEELFGKGLGDRLPGLGELEDVLRQMEGQSEREVVVMTLNAVWRKADAIAFFKGLGVILQGMA